MRLYGLYIDVEDHTGEPFFNMIGQSVDLESSHATHAIELDAELQGQKTTRNPASTQ